MRISAKVFLLLALGACTPSGSSVPSEQPVESASPVEVPPPPAVTASAATIPVEDPPVSEAKFHPRLLEIARDYMGWGRVDDEVRWAPLLCRMPMPAAAHVSASSDSATHGDKLYSLFAKDWKGYVNNASAPDQVLVKESWKPERVSDPKSVPSRYQASAGAGTGPDDDHFHPYAVGEDGAVFHATERLGLYVMFKLDAKTADTDEGWVYGTVDTNGMVTSAGRVASCMGCHRKAKHDRLFGLQ